MLAFVTSGSNGGGQNRAQETEDDDDDVVGDNEILDGGDKCDPRSKLKALRDSISTLV